LRYGACGYPDPLAVIGVGIGVGVGIGIGVDIRIFLPHRINFSAYNHPTRTSRNQTGPSGNIEYRLHEPRSCTDQIAAWPSHRLYQCLTTSLVESYFNNGVNIEYRSCEKFFASENENFTNKTRIPCLRSICQAFASVS